MAYVKTNWKDRKVAAPNTFTKTDNANGTVTLTPAPGTVTEEGTPVNAENMNHIEQGISGLYDTKVIYVDTTTASKTLAANANTEFTFSVIVPTGYKIASVQVIASSNPSHNAQFTHATFYDDSNGSCQLIVHNHFSSALTDSFLLRVILVYNS